MAKGTDFGDMVRVARPRGGVTTKQLARAAPGAASLAHRRAPATSQFGGAEKFNADLSKWNVAKGTNFQSMVRAARPRGGVASTQLARAATVAASIAHRRARAGRVAVRRRELVQRRPLRVERGEGDELL